MRARPRSLRQGELVSDTLAIDGPGADLLTIDASGNDPTPDENNGDGSRIFDIEKGHVTNPFDPRTLAGTHVKALFHADSRSIALLANTDLVGLYRCAKTDEPPS